MTATEPVRWGILGTARIAVGNFLPSLRASGTGVPYAVASRSLDSARAFAADQQIEHAVDGYGALLDNPDIEAVYIPLPNNLHAQWAIAALRAGKAVLCEKPLCLTEAEVRSVLDVARETGQLLWEAFVFPYNRQSARLKDLIQSGDLGEVVEVRSVYHFAMGRTNDIRLKPETGGGSLYDVGCYCIRFAQFVFESMPERAAAFATFTESGVDATLQAMVEYPDRCRLTFSSSLALPQETSAIVVGSKGTVSMDGAFHPRAGNEMIVSVGDRVERHDVGGEEPTFTPALSHMNAAIRGEEQPRHLAVDDSLGTARAIDLIREKIQ
jgi:predicted dehydrogenase